MSKNLPWKYGIYSLTSFQKADEKPSLVSWDCPFHNNLFATEETIQNVT